MKQRKAPSPRPLKPGDYFRCKYGNGQYVHLKIGPHWTDDVHVATCATERGAERLAALMNEARDLVRDFHDVTSSSPYKLQSPRDWAAHCIAAALCEALDTPLPYCDPREQARDSILYFERLPGDEPGAPLAKLFEVLDAAGTPTTLDDAAARFALLKHSSLGRRHYTEVIRSWRRSFDKSIAVIDRAEKAIACARAGNCELAAGAAADMPKAESA
jgi:hypothetical protein